MPDPPFMDGEVVWVKWSSCWWPGEVWESSRVPEDILNSLRKSVIAFVKFFQEDSFEIVRNINAIEKYDCEKKLEYIRKGMDKYRKNSKMMSNFPGDVTKAEELTGGNVKILDSFQAETKQKAPSLASPEKSFVESPPVSSPKKSAGTYNSSTKVQFRANAAPKSEKKFKCTLCDFSTERINLLMLHIKNHSSTLGVHTSDPSLTIAVRKSSVKTPSKKFVDPNDSIDDDVRKIKESMKKDVKPPAPAKKYREKAKTTPTVRSSRSAKKVRKLTVEEETKPLEKPKDTNELKNKLLADWSDDDEVDQKLEELQKSSPPKPNKPFEKAGESSRFIRNIPKKQKIGESYITPEPIKETVTVDKPKVEKMKTPANSIITDVEKKNQRANKRNSVVGGPEPAKPLEERNDERLLTATADLLSVTEVPTLEGTQLPSTFHKSTDIFKTMPPKERNKRIFRAKISSESPLEANDNFLKSDNNGSMTKVDEPFIVSPVQNELMLPHKKKQSSRLVTTDKPSLVREPRNVHESKQELPTTESRTRKKNKSFEGNLGTELTEVEMIPQKTSKAEKQGVQSPLRDTVDVNNEVISSESATSATSNSISISRRGQKRHSSKYSTSLTDAYETGPQPKKFHKSEAEILPKTIDTANETVYISSEGHLSVEHRDLVVATTENTEVVTSQVVITEATHQPIVNVSPCSEAVISPKPQISTINKTLKNALMVPPEELLEMKKHGLVTVGVDMKNKLTTKGKEMFKKVKEKTSGELIEPKEKIEVEQVKHQESPNETFGQMKASDGDEKTVKMETAEKVEEVARVSGIKLRESPIKESKGSSVAEENVNTNNNVIEKETVMPDATQSKENEEEQIAPESIENGKEAEADAGVAADDPNNGGAGLIALQAENFGGPPNCFYLCRQIEDRYEPVDNQILVLNAQNALVPYEGDIVSEDSIALTEVITENLAGFPQLSPQSNIIINTPNGQKIELSHFAIASLQEQADDNGIATVELHGEQLELNITEILEAISAQQEGNESESLVPDGALILDATDLPTTVEVHHSATQVSKTLTKPIMSTTVAPEILAKATAETIATKNLNIEDSLATIGVTTQPTRCNVPKSLELPITITNPTIAETVNHRKLTNTSVFGDLVEVGEEVEPDSSNIIVVQIADNGSRN